MVLAFRGDVGRRSIEDKSASKMNRQNWLSLALTLVLSPTLFTLVRRPTRDELINRSLRFFPWASRQHLEAQADIVESLDRDLEELVSSLEVDKDKGVSIPWPSVSVCRLGAQGEKATYRCEASFKL